MTKYERTGETTDDPAVAVGWGLWRSSGGNLYRVASGTEPTIQYQPASGGHWSTALGLGLTPYHRMREAVEPKSGAELRRWLVAHPGVEVKPVPPMEPGGWQAWWDPEACRFTWTVKIDFDPTDGPHVPDGGRWDR